MIKPWDKARELVKQFMDYKPVKFSDYTKIEYPSAINLAKICVDEIIDSLDKSLIHADIEYWREVKIELNLL